MLIRDLLTQRTNACSDAALVDHSDSSPRPSHPSPHRGEMVGTLQPSSNILIYIYTYSTGAVKSLRYFQWSILELRLFKKAIVYFISGIKVQFEGQGVTRAKQWEDVKEGVVIDVGHLYLYLINGLHVIVKVYKTYPPVVERSNSQCFEFMEAHIPEGELLLSEGFWHRSACFVN